MTAPSTIEIGREFSERLVVHTNVGQEVMVTTVDKVRICLMENRECLTSQREWLTPFSLFVALLTTLAAADFRQFLLKAETWQAIYIVGTVISGAWSGVAGYRAWNNRNRASIDAIVSALKAQLPPSAVVAPTDTAASKRGAV